MRPFWQDLVLQIAGPLCAALVGSLAVGLFAQSIARRAQSRRDAQQLRDGFVKDLTGCAIRLYLATQHYWRAKDVEGRSTEQLALERARLDEDYRQSRIAGDVLEARLSAYFETEVPRRLTHQVMDLLTVRYFQVIDLDTEGLRRSNAGPEHSGLEAEELASAPVVLEANRRALAEALRAITEDRMRIHG